MKNLLRFLLTRFPASLQSDLLRSFRNVRDNLGLIRAYRYDRRQYRAHSGLFRLTEPAVVDAAIIKDCHRIEKGLALQHPRPGFGRGAVDSVMERGEYPIANYRPSHKKMHGIPGDRAVIMLFAVGHLPPEMLVARSQRRPLSEVLHFI